MPAGGLIEPTHLAIGQLQAGKQRVGSVEQGDPRPAFGHQRQLVAHIARLVAMPVQMLGKQIQHQCQLGTRAAAPDITGLIAGQLDRPIRRRRLRCQHFQKGLADISDQGGAMPGCAQHVRQQRSGGALALGAGDADDARHAAVRLRVFGKPQRGAANEMRALRSGSQCLGAIRADAGRLHDDLESSQRLRAGIGFHLQGRICQRTDLTRLFGVAEHRQRLSRQARPQRTIRRTSFAPPAPQRNSLAFKLRNSHARAPTAPAESGARHRWP